MTQIVWRKPCSAASNCVEVAIDGGNILIRDSKTTDGPQLTWPAADWKAFCHHIRHGWTPAKSTFAPLDFSPAELDALADDIRHPQPVAA